MKLKAKCSCCGKTIQTHECKFNRGWNARFSRMFEKTHGVDAIMVHHECGNAVCILSEEQKDFMNRKAKAANA